MTVYILAQRLQAQNVPTDKSKRVLQDVIRTMYNKMFIDELFRPQDVYSMHSTRQIFDRLAHSSIMRLNESSMDKLFDLMTMGFKYQMLACSYPQELLFVTLNHLYQLRAKVEDSDVCPLVDQIGHGGGAIDLRTQLVEVVERDVEQLLRVAAGDHLILEPHRHEVKELVHARLVEPHDGRVR